MKSLRLLLPAMALAALFLLVLWRVEGDAGGLPPRFISDMIERQDGYLPPPPGSIPCDPNTSESGGAATSNGTTKPGGTAEPGEETEPTGAAGQGGTAEPDGAALFRQHCAFCHGEDGKAETFVARQPGMPDVGQLAHPTYSPARQRTILREGQGAMPAFGSRLSPPQLEALLRYISSLSVPSPPTPSA